MVVVVVAGGLGDLGRLMVEELIVSGEHEVFILSRRTPQDLSRYRTKSGKEFPPVLQTDYQQASLRAVLESTKAHTVISALQLDWEDAAVSQIQLIKAASASSSVKRFIPSEFNIDYDLDDDILPYASKVYHSMARRELEKTDLEFTYIYCGMFMDYFGMPYFPTEMRALYHVVDLAHQKAVVPGDGTATMSTTYTLDVARLVARSLGLPSWARVYYIVGSAINSNDLIKLAERKTGDTFDITHDSMEDLRAKKATILPSNADAAAHFDGGASQVSALIADLSVPLALGAYNVKEAKDAVSLVEALGERAGHVMTLEEFFDITCQEKARRTQDPS